MAPQNGPKSAQKWDQQLKKKTGFILGPFWVHFGVRFGVRFGLEWAKMRQYDSNEDIKSLKVPRNIIFEKCDLP